MTPCCRWGWLQLRTHLPKMVDAVTSAGQVVTWVCDPMHGNTECVAGYKTRRYDNIRAEVGAPSLHISLEESRTRPCLGPGFGKSAHINHGVPLKLHAILGVSQGVLIEAHKCTPCWYVAAPFSRRCSPCPSSLNSFVIIF